MTDEGAYEIMPYKEIVELKKQIAELSQKSGDNSPKELLQSMAALTKSINDLISLFGSAAEEMKLEEKTEGELSQKIGPLIDKVSNLEQQNRTIAEGLVAVADMVKQMKSDKKIQTRPRQNFESEDEEVEDRPVEPTFFARGGPKARRPMPPIHAGGPGMTAPPMAPGMMPQGMMPPMPPLGMSQAAEPEFGELPPLPPFEDEPKKKGLFGMFK